MVCYMFKRNIIALWNENDHSVRDVSSILFPWHGPKDYSWTVHLTLVFIWWDSTGTETASSAGLHHARLDIFCFGAKLTLWPCHALLISHWQTGLVGSLCPVKATQFSLTERKCRYFSTVEEVSDKTMRSTIRNLMAQDLKNLNILNVHCNNCKDKTNYDHLLLFFINTFPKIFSWESSYFPL